MEEDKKKPGKKRKSFDKAPNLVEIGEMVETQGLATDTLQKRSAVEKNFRTFLEQWGMKNLDLLCKAETEEELIEFQMALASFFNSYTVKDNELPMKNYADVMKSHLRVSIKKMTNGKIDICDQIRMPRFHVSFLNCFFMLL